MMLRVGQLKKNLCDWFDQHPETRESIVEHLNAMYSEPPVITGTDNPDNWEWEGPVAFPNDHRHSFRLKPYDTYEYSVVLNVHCKINSLEISDVRISK